MSTNNEYSLNNHDENDSESTATLVNYFYLKYSKLNLVFFYRLKLIHHQIIIRCYHQYNQNIR